MDLRYGLNPHRRPATATALRPGTPPVRLVHGGPSYVNLLDALSGWQLVREAASALGVPAAASFKHVSPAGAAIAGPLDAVAAEAFGVDPAALSPLAAAYLRARDTDPRSSYGDFVAVSHPVDASLAEVLRRLVCDGIVAPGFEPGTVATLAAKKRGSFCILESDPGLDPGSEPPAEEVRDVYGLRLTQATDRLRIGPELLADAGLPDGVTGDVLLGMIVTRFTQSNSVAYLHDGATLGVGAGQQSRVDCTRLAGGKVATWWLRRHEHVQGLAFADGVGRQDRVAWRMRFAEGDLTAQEQRQFLAAADGPPPELSDADRREWLRRLDGVTFVSDGAIPFRDNVDHAARYGVATIAEPGGSIRSAEVTEACAEHGITHVRTGVRLFQR